MLYTSRYEPKLYRYVDIYFGQNAITCPFVSPTPSKNLHSANSLCTIIWNSRVGNWFELAQGEGVLILSYTGGYNFEFRYFGVCPRKLNCFRVWRYCGYSFG